jgi:DoxX-like family
MVETFEKVGVGQWFRYVTGAIEIGSAVLLLIPRLTAVGAALLFCTMAGAVLSHRLLLGGSPVPALVLGVFAALILWGRFGTVKAWLGPPGPGPWRRFIGCDRSSCKRHPASISDGPSGPRFQEIAS